MKLCIFAAGVLLLGATALGQTIPIDSIRLNDANGAPVLTGATVSFTGIVTATTQFGNSGPGFIQDRSARMPAGFAGVAVYGNALSSVSILDSVTVTGIVDSFNGLTEIMSPTINVISRGRAVPPIEVPIARLGDTADRRETYEGLLVKVRRAQFLTTGSFSGGQSYTVQDASGQGIVYIDAQDTSIVGKPIPTDTVDIVGCVSQYDNSAPYFSGYQLMPRFYSDFIGATPPSAIKTIAEALIDTLPPLTVPDLVGTTVTVTGIVTVPFGVLSSTRTDIFIQDRTAGVNVFSFTPNSELKLGDSLVVTGKVDTFKGKPELTSPTIVRADSNHPVPEPATVSCRAVDKTRNYLGSLVRITGLSATNLVVTSGSNTILDSSGSANLFVSSTSEVPGFLMVDDTFSVIGVKSQYDNTPLPHDAGYEIIPRFRSDFSRGMEQSLPLLSIREVQSPGSDGYSSQYEGRFVKVRGRITGPSYVFTSGSSRSFYVQDSTLGVNVYAPTCDTVSGVHTDSIGAKFEVIGKVTEYNGITEIANGVVRLITDTLPPITPDTLPFNGFLTEALESKVITVTGDVITPPASMGGGVNFTIKNGNPGIDIRVVSGAGIPLNWVKPGKRVQVTGIVGQYTSTFPYADGYQLMPVFRSDLVDVTPAESAGLRMRFSRLEPQVFNPSVGQVCRIALESPSERKLYLQVFDLQGRMVKDLLVNVPGHYYEITWDGTDDRLERLPIGTYVLNLKGVRSDGKTEVERKLVVLGTRLN